MLHLEIHNKKEGSTVLYILMITGCLIPVMYGYWQMAVMYSMLMQDRIKEEQRFWLIDGAMQYGIAYAQHHFDTLIQHKRTISLNMYAHLLDKKYTLHVLFSPITETCIQSKAELFYNNVLVYTISCMMHKKNQKVCIDEWAIH